MSRGGAINIFTNTILVDYYAIYWSAAAICTQAFSFSKSLIGSRRPENVTHNSNIVPYVCALFNIIKQYTKEFLWLRNQYIGVIDHSERITGHQHRQAAAPGF